MCLFYSIEIKETNQRMREELKDSIVALLKEQGFTGSIPTFRRVRNSSYQVINFQFNKYGGSFAVNMELVEPTEEFFSLPYSKLNIVNSRRLGSLNKHLKNKHYQDHWFKFIKGLFFKRNCFDKAAQEFFTVYKQEAEITFNYMQAETNTDVTHEKWTLI